MKNSKILVKRREKQSENNFKKSLSEKVLIKIFR